MLCSVMQCELWALINTGVCVSKLCPINLMKKQSTWINNTAGTKRKMCLFWSGLGWTRKIKTVVSAVFLALHHQMQTDFKMSKLPLLSPLQLKFLFKISKVQSSADGSAKLKLIKGSFDLCCSVTWQFCYFSTSTLASICVWLHLIEVAINIYEWELMLFKDVVSCLLTKVLC